MLRDLAGLAVHSLDSEDWLQTSCRPPAPAVEEDDNEGESAEQADQAERAPRLDEGQVAGADGDDGSYRGEGGDSSAEDKTDEQTKKEQKESKDKKKKTEAKPMPMTLLETAFKGLAESARRSRAALLTSLEDDIHQHAVQYSDYTGKALCSRCMETA